MVRNEMPIDSGIHLREYDREELARQTTMKIMKLISSLAGKLVASATLLAVMLLTLNVHAQTQAGRAEVRGVKGVATYSTAGGAPQPLKVGIILPSGSVVKTEADSSVDLFLGHSAGVVRVTENTTLGLDKLSLTDTGAETVVEVQLNVPDGTILGNVNKLSAASKYEIKLPNGVAGIRGTRFRCSSTGYIVLLEGTMVFVFVPPGGNPTPYTLVAPPPVYFSPIEGIRPAPDDLIREVERQLGRDVVDGREVLPSLLPPNYDPYETILPGISNDETDEPVSPGTEN